MNKPFDAISYFHGLAKCNKLAAQNKFYPCTCSGLTSLEDIIFNAQRQSGFICVEDTNESGTVQISGGWFVTRVITVFVLHRYRLDDMEDRQQQLDICRDIFHQFHSRLIRDKELLQDDLAYLDVENVTSREFGQYVMSGLTGLYFMIKIQEPINLCYDGSQWTE